MKLRSILIHLALGISFLIGCDHGLDPEQDSTTPGIDGIAHILEPWPDTLGVGEVYIIAFRDIPVDSASAFQQFLAGGIGFTGPFQPGDAEYPFSLDLAPGRYAYLSCVGLRGANLLSISSWLVMGVYTASGSSGTPEPLDISEDGRLRDIEITIRFSSLPPQPF